MHLRVFGCKYYVHNNRKEPLGKFDPRSDETIFLGYSSHSKVCKVFNKRILCVEESVHVLFDETNSLIKHDTQDEEFELGLMRKDFLLIQSSRGDNGEAPESEPNSKSDKVKGEQGAHQSGRSNAEPNLVRSQSTQLDPFQTDLGVGSRTELIIGSITDPELVLPHIQERLKSVSVDSIIPRP